MGNRTGKLSLLVTAAAVLLAACGGGGSSITKAEFVKQADAICLKAKKKQAAGLEKAVKGEPGAELTPAEIENVIMTAVIPPYRQAANELSELPTPSGGADEVDAMVASLEEALEKGEKQPASVNSVSNSPFKTFDKQASEYGLEACSAAP